MIQAIGLTSLPRRHQLKPTVDDLTFEARPGRVTVLLGPRGSGKTSALRLMLQLQPGRGIALFRGRPVHRVAHLAREVGVLLGDVPGHPARTARSHLRMLTAAAGVPTGRADDVLDVVGLSGLADQRMGMLSRGMDRRLGVACALLGDPHTLVMDEPAHGLSPRETNWLYSLLRGYATQGGTVLVTSHRADEAADLADRVVSIDSGRLVADQESADFVRTRLRPRVAVRTPHAERLTSVLTQEARKAGPAGRDSGPLKVVREDGSRVSVYGSSCAEVGEYAYRHGILVHQLTDESGDAGDAGTPAPLDRADGRRASLPSAGSASAAEPAASEGESAYAAEDSEAAPATRDSGTEPVMSEAEVAPATPEEPSEPATSEMECAPTASGRQPGLLPPEPASAQSAPQPETELATADAELGHAAPEPDSGTDDSDSDSDIQTDSDIETDPELVPALVAATPAAEASSPEGESSSADVSVPADAPASAASVASAAESPSASASPQPATDSVSTLVPLASPDAPTVRISDSPLVDSSTPRSAAPERPVTAAVSRSPQPSWTPTRPPARAAAELPPQMHAVARPGPVAPLRYELRRLFSVRTTWVTMAAAVVTALCLALVLARTGIGLPPASDSTVAPAVRLLTGWPSGGVFLLPPVAVAVGLLGALAFGEEFRYPALAPARSPVPRRLSLLASKLAVSAALSVVLSLAVAALNAAALTLFFGPGVLALSSATSDSAFPPAGSSGGDAPWQLHVAAVLAFTTGCAWAGLLAAGIFRSATLGTAVVLAVPILIAPAVRPLLGGSTGRSLDGLPERLEAALLVPWPPGAERWVSAAIQFASQPVAQALALSLAVLFFVHLVTAVRSRAR